jgi:3-hydroxyacyl-CoA dehydrogenase
MSAAPDAARVAVRLEREGEVAVIVIDNPPVNAASAAVRRGLLAAVEAASADSAAEAVVVIGAGTTFVAGSDIREFGKPLEDPQLPAVLEAMARSPKPFVAAIHGAALGGGFELALGCDARIAVADAVVGLPEVTLGMIPGAGGTQHVPRLIGVAAAIGMICSGERVVARKALALGLIDGIAEGDLRTAAIGYARTLQGRKRRLREEGVPADAAGGIEAAEQAALKAGRNRPAVVAAIEALKSAASQPYAQALAREREVFQALRGSREAAALRHLFFAEREAGKVPGLEGVQARTIASVGVIGAGTMGAGIAMCFADAGLPVTLVDQDDASVQRGLERMRKAYDGSVRSGRITPEESQRRMARVTPATHLDTMADADLVVEAVFEDMDVKTELFRRLDGIAKPGAILATNTSYLDVDRIAAATARPEDVVGLHFFSPAPVMRLLEIVRAANTGDAALATALAIGRRIRKLCVVARVGDGFIGNRIYAAYRQQAEYMLEEGAYPEEVDAAIEGFGFAMGPFAVSDLAGLDIAWRNRQRLAATRDARSRYVAVADQLCERQRFGQKSGAGWYRYAAGARRGEPDPEVRALIDAASAAKGIVRRRFDADEIRRRALVTMVNEAALLLEEGIAQRASDVDLVLVNGYGFPKHEGGPLFWAAGQDRARIAAELDQLEAVSGPGFRRGDLAALLARGAD